MTTDDDRRDAAVAFLRSHGAATTPHVYGDLLSHLTGVEDLVRAWGGSDRLALAALVHATYGTGDFEPLILEVSERAELADIVGAEVEELVYFYASCDRDAFYPQLAAPDAAPGDLRFRDRFTGTERSLRPEEIRDFVDLSYANGAEQTISSPGSRAGRAWLRDFCTTTRRWASPGFYGGVAELLQMEG